MIIFETIWRRVVDRSLKVTWPGEMYVSHKQAAQMCSEIHISPTTWMQDTMLYSLPCALKMNAETCLGRKNITISSSSHAIKNITISSSRHSQSIWLCPFRQGFLIFPCLRFLIFPCLYQSNTGFTMLMWNWVTKDYTSHSTQNRSFWTCSSRLILWLILKKLKTG